MYATDNFGSPIMGDSEPSGFVTIFVDIVYFVFGFRYIQCPLKLPIVVFAVKFEIL
jgi:hypothetical protein